MKRLAGLPHHNRVLITRGSQGEKCREAFGFHVMYFYDVTFWPARLDYFKINL